MDLQITCTNKTNRQDPHDRIHNVGGEHAGNRWKKSQTTAISETEAKVIIHSTLALMASERMSS